MNKPKLNKYISFTISKEKSLLEILDSVEETKDIRDVKDIRDIRDKKDIRDIRDKNICKCCSKYIIKYLEEHQIKCFQNKISILLKKIEELNRQTDLLKETLMHDIKIKGLELVLQRNEEKWNKIYNCKI